MRRPAKTAEFTVQLSRSAPAAGRTAAAEGPPYGPETDRDRVAAGLETGRE